MRPQCSPANSQQWPIKMVISIILPTKILTICPRLVATHHSREQERSSLILKAVLPWLHRRREQMVRVKTSPRERSRRLSMTNHSRQVLPQIATMNRLTSPLVWNLSGIRLLQSLLHLKKLEEAYSQMYWVAAMIECIKNELLRQVEIVHINRKVDKQRIDSLPSHSNFRVSR